MKKHFSIKASSCLDMINAFNRKIHEFESDYVNSAEAVNAGDCDTNCDKKQKVTADQYIHGDESDNLIDEAYVDDMMQYVADETMSLDPPFVCSWYVDGDSLIFILTGIETDTVDEYTCPLSDLTGDINVDIQYIVDSINASGIG